MRRWLCAATSPKVRIVSDRYYACVNFPLYYVVVSGCHGSPRLSSCVHGARFRSAMVGEMRSSIWTARRSVANLQLQVGAMNQNGFKSSSENDPGGEFGSKHFDLQDVDADRLTHFYWDRDEDGNPYQGVPDFRWMCEDEFERDNLAYVSMEDRKYLISEYL